VILACSSRHVLGLNSCSSFNRWWLCIDVIEDLLDYVWVNDVGDDTHDAPTQRAHGNIKRIVILKRIYSEFQKYPNWAFFEFERLNDSLSVVVGQCLNS
jgi:hypothetical protein